MALSLTSHLEECILLQTSDGLIRITLTDVSANLGKQPRASARLNLEAPASVRIWREPREARKPQGSPAGEEQHQRRVG